MEVSIGNSINLQLQNFFNGLSDAVLIFSNEQICKYANPNAERFFNKAANLLIDRSLAEIIPNYHFTGLAALIHLAKNQNQGVSGFCVLPVNNQSCKINVSTIDLNIALVIAPSIQQTSTVSKSSPIISDEEKQYKLIVEHSPDVVLRWDNALRLIYCNKPNLNGAILTGPDLIGKNLFEMGYPAEVAARWTARLRSAFELGEAQDDHNLYNVPNSNQQAHSRIIPEFDFSSGTVKSLLTISRDVMSFKKAETELKKSNALLEGILKAPNMGVNVYKAIRDAEGEIIDFEYLILSQKSIELNDNIDLTGQRLLQQNEYNKPLYWHLKRVVETGMPRTFEHSYLLNNTRRWLCNSDAKFEDGVINVWEDITNRKNDEAELYKHLAILQQTEELAEMGSWDYDIHAQKLIWSEGMYRLFNIELGTKVKPEIYIDCAIKEDKGLARRIVDKITKSNEAFEETLRIRPHNEIKTIKLKATVINDKAGNPHRMLGVDLNITAALKAEEQIRAQAHFINNVTDATPDMIVVTNLFDTKVTYVNDQVIKAFKVSKEIIYHAGPALFYNALHPDDYDLRVRQMTQLKSLEDDEVREVEVRMKVSDEYRWFRFRDKIFERDADGSVKQTISIMQDVHDMKITEAENKNLEARHREAVIEAQEEEQKRISEALHNDLGQILFITKLKAREGPQSETLKLLDTAIQTVRRISFELSPILLQDFGLETALRDTTDKKLIEAGIKSRLEMVNLQSKLPHVIEISIFRIVQELINNAIKHSKATEVVIRIIKLDTSISLQYSDNGVGFRDKNPTPEANGLGWLMITDRVKLLQGNIKVTHPKEVGLNINIDIPITG